MVWSSYFVFFECAWKFVNAIRCYCCCLSECGLMPKLSGMVDLCLRFGGILIGSVEVLV